MNDAIEFRPAVKEDVRLMIGLAGPSGGGKTWSALRLAVGLAQGGPIFFIDTESGRGAHYADKFHRLHGFRYQYATLAAPFSPERYQAAIAAAVKAGAAVVIVDSASHMHEGPGGVLEWHDRELTRMAGDDFRKREKATFTAWIKPKAAVNQFSNFVLQAPVHFIFCFRAKDKLELKKVDGKTEPVRVGWTPICTDRLDFEMTATLVLPPGADGVPDLAAKARKIPDDFRDIFREGRQIDEAMGAQLAAWAKGGAATKPAAQQPAPEPDRLLTDGRAAAGNGMVSLEAFWRGLPNDRKRRLKPEMDALKATALKADEEAAEPVDDDVFPADRPSQEAAE